MTNKPQPYLIGYVLDEDINTVHVLHGKTYILIAQFAMKDKQQTIDQIKPYYPEIAEKLKRYKGGFHENI